MRWQKKEMRKISMRKELNEEAGHPIVELQVNIHKYKQETKFELINFSMQKNPYFKRILPLSGIFLQIPIFFSNFVIVT